MPKSFAALGRATVEFTRPSNTTAYTAGDNVCPTTLAVTGATNASPIVVTSVGHGLITGDFITVASVGGNTNANGDRLVVKIDADTFSMTDTAGAVINGNSAYTSGGTITRVLRLRNLARKSSAGGTATGKITKTRLIALSATVTNGTFRVYFFNAPVTQIADNAAWMLLYANRDKIIGYSGALTLVTEGSGSDCAIAEDLTVVPFQCSNGSQDLWAYIIAEGAYGPASAETFYLEVTAELF